MHDYTMERILWPALSRAMALGLLAVATVCGGRIARRTHHTEATDAAFNGAAVAPGRSGAAGEQGNGGRAGTAGSTAASPETVTAGSGSSNEAGAGGRGAAAAKTQAGAGGVTRGITECAFIEDHYAIAHDSGGAAGHSSSLDAMVFREGLVWILEADIQAFFDSLNRSRLKEILQQRVADQSFMRLVGKCLQVGVLDGEVFTRPEEGTAQGSIISPMLGNVYLHHVLDQWFEREVKATLAGRARMIRYADDFVMGFETQEDAELVMAMLHRRMADYSLTLHPDKTRLIAFQRPYWSQSGATVPASVTHRARS